MGSCHRIVLNLLGQWTFYKSSKIRAVFRKMVAVDEGIGDLSLLDANRIRISLSGLNMCFEPLATCDGQNMFYISFVPLTQSSGIDKAGIPVELSGDPHMHEDGDN